MTEINCNRQSDMKPKINPLFHQETSQQSTTQPNSTTQATRQHNVRILTIQSNDRHTSMHVATERRTVYLYTHAWPEHLLKWSKNDHSIQHDASTFRLNNFTAYRNTWRRFLAATVNTKWDITPLHTKNTLKGIKTFYESKFCSSLACSWRCIFQEDIKQHQRQCPSKSSL
jgi:hypothetical protein